MKYEWDPVKAETNFRDHGVRFEDAIPALKDPNRIEDADIREDYSENRDIAIGMAQGRVLYVVFIMSTDDNKREVCRIISARKAEPYEEDRYYTGDQENW